MRPVTKQGPQPPSCCVEDCDRDPTPGDVMCPGHLRLTLAQNGSQLPGISNSLPVVQPDDPRLLEAAANQAKEAEAKEYAERRRVKTWKTLESGTRIPEEYWSDEELAAMEENEDRHVAELTQRIATLDTNRLPQPAEGLSLRDRLAVLESESEHEDYEPGLAGMAFHKETAERRAELLGLVNERLGTILNAETRDQVKTTARALRTLIYEELRGADW